MLLLSDVEENYGCCYYVLWERIMVVIMCCEKKLRLFVLFGVGDNYGCRCYYMLWERITAFSDFLSAFIVAKQNTVITTNIG